MAFLRRTAGILLVLLVALGLAASGAAHEALHSHHPPHQGCQLCILGGTAPAPPPRPEIPYRLRGEWIPPLVPALPEVAPTFRLRTRGPPSPLLSV